MKNVLVVDCHDSFVYNLVQLLRECEHCIFDIVQVNKIDFSTLPSYSHVLLSPGPGLPGEFPNLMKLIDRTHKSHAILGVCLGLQAIGEYFGGKLLQLSHPLHGHTGHLVITDKTEQIFKNIPHNAEIGHYHSWLLDEKTLPDSLIITAKDTVNQIMADSHKTLPIRGVQFHPESIITKDGAEMIINWLDV